MKSREREKKKNKKCAQADLSALRTRASNRQRAVDYDKSVRCHCTVSKLSFPGKFSSNYKITIGADFAIKTLNWGPHTKINLQLWYGNLYNLLFTFIYVTISLSFFQALTSIFFAIFQNIS